MKHGQKTSLEVSDTMHSGLNSARKDFPEAYNFSWEQCIRIIRQTRVTPVMQEYLMDYLSSVESQHPNCGIILLGDFNKLNIVRLKRCYDLKQIVNFPTRGPNTLDKSSLEINIFS